MTPTHGTAGPAGEDAAGGKRAGEGTAQENAGQDNTAHEGKASTPASAQAAAGTDGILPNKAAEDDPHRWGDGSEDDHDAWLKEQKPPHWG